LLLFSVSAVVFQLLLNVVFSCPKADLLVPRFFAAESIPPLFFVGDAMVESPPISK